jgi:hypothetical protein
MGRVKTYGWYPDCVSWDESGPEDIYEFTLATLNARITATLSSYSADLDVCLLRECGQQTCFSHGDVEAVATDVYPGRYYIAVDGFNGAEGSYMLSLECSERQVYLPAILKGA